MLLYLRRAQGAEEGNDTGVSGPCALHRRPMCFLQVGTKSLKSESMCGKKDPEKGWREKKGKGEARDCEVVHGSLH